MRGPSIPRATPALAGFAAFVVIAGCATPLAGQAPRKPVTPASTWASVFIVGYPGIGHFSSPVGPDGSTAVQNWNFGSGLGLGLAAAHNIGTAAQVGLEATLAPSVGVEITDSTGTTTTTGNSSVGDVFATGRLMTGGGAGLGLFLAGGVGAMFFGMPSPASSATDLAYRFGGGVEYQFNPRRAAFLEWGSIGAFHKHHGVSSNTIHFSQLRGGIRIGW